MSLLHSWVYLAKVQSLTDKVWTFLVETKEMYLTDVQKTSSLKKIFNDV